MAATALIKFTQGISVGVAGEAMKGVTATSVTVGNGNNADVASWQIDLLYADPASAIVASIPYAFSNNSNTPTATFTPDVRGSYRWQLKVWDAPNRAGNPSDVDIRVFSVPELHGLVVPPPQLWPAPLPQPESGQVGAKPHEMNFGGQPDGWAGNGSNDGLMNELIRRIDAGVGGPPTPTALADVLAEGNVTGPNDIVLSNGQAVIGAPGTSGPGQDGNDAEIRGGAAVDNGSGGDVVIRGGAGAGAGTTGLVRVHDAVDPTDPRDVVNLQSMTAAIAASKVAKQKVVGVAGPQTTNLTGPVSVGTLVIDPADYPGGTFVFEAAMFTENVTAVATLRLYNLTDGEVVTGTTITTPALALTRVVSAALTVGSASGNLKNSLKTYEVQLYRAGGGVDDYVDVHLAQISVSM